MDAGHGRLLTHSSWERKPYFCPHAAHGGNGRFFTEAEAFGEFSWNEDDEMMVYQEAAAAIISGTRDMDEAVRSIAKSTKSSTDKVRERLSTMVAAAKATAAEKAAERAQERAAKKAAEDAAKAEKAAAKKAERDAKAAAKGEPKAPRVLKEQVPPTEFAAVRDRLGLKNGEVAKAIGRSPSRATELTRSLGGSRDIFDSFVVDVERFAAEKAEAAAKAAAETPAE